MKRLAAALGVVTMTVWAATTLAQGRNFAGTWTFDETRTPLPNGAIRIAAGADGATRTDNAPPMTVGVDSTSFSWGPNTYKLGGTTVLQDKMRGGSIAFRAAWKGDKMVVEELAAI